jgi:nucleotide-binding universal stress UspA family protein
MFSKILVPLDRSSLAEQAIGQAAAIARGSGGGATIDIVLVHEPFPFAGYADLPWDGGESDAEQKYVEAIAAEITSGAGVPATSAVLRGTPADMICQRVRETGAQLVVMTSHGRTGFSRAWLGSVADAVMRNSTAPVLMLRPEHGAADRVAPPDKSIKRVLVPLDGSSLAASVIPSAATLAEAAHATLLLVRVVPIVPVLTAYEPTTAITVVPLVSDPAATTQLADAARQEIEAVADRLRDDTKLAVEAHVVVDERPANAIVDFATANDVDVIAMSTHGRHASRWLFGSVADKVLRASQIPVLLYRAIETDDRPVGLDEADVAKEGHSVRRD